MVANAETHNEISSIQHEAKPPYRRRTFILA